MECACCNAQEKAHRRVSPSIRMQTQMEGGEQECHHKWIFSFILIKVTVGQIHQKFTSEMGKDQSAAEADDVAVFA